MIDLLPTRRLVTLACVALVAVAGGGCGRRRPTVEMVEGLVLLDGRPIDKATVGFAPIDPKQGLHAVGLTDSSGAFRLTAMRGGASGAGTAIGDYSVVVGKMVNVDSDSKAALPKPRPGQLVPKLVQAGAGLPDYLILVPEAYGEQATSGLTATVKKGLNTFTFELRSDYNPAVKALLPSRNASSEKRP